MIHHLKTWPTYFVEVVDGTKTFDIRKNDRDFQRDDILILEEYDPNTQQYTGRSITKKIGFVLYDTNADFGSALNQGYCCISLLLEHQGKNGMR